MDVRELPATMPKGSDVTNFYGSLGRDDGALREAMVELDEVPLGQTNVVDESDAGPAFATLAELMERPELLQPPRCVVPRLAYRGRLVVLAGPDKSGKSTLLAHATAAVSRGHRFLDGTTVTQHRRAVVLGLEGAVGDSVRRFSELGADPERIHLVVLAPPDLLTRTRELLSEHPADLIVVDSLQEYARVTLGTVPDDGDAAGWASVVRPLVALARDHDVAVVVLCHVRRSDGQYRGSTEIAAAADALLELVVPTSGDDLTVRRLRGRGRWPVEPFAVALRDGRYEMAGGNELSIDARVLLFVEANPGQASRTATRKAVGGRASTVDAAIDQLLERGAIEDRGSGKMSLYMPSEQLSTEAA